MQTAHSLAALSASPPGDLLIAVEQNVDLWAVHRAGVDNVLADFLSRPTLHGGGDGAAITRAWARTHPTLSAALHSVSVVYSRQFMRPLRAATVARLRAQYTYAPPRAVVQPADQSAAPPVR